MNFTVVNAMYYEYDVNESKDKIVGTAMEVGDVQGLAEAIVNLTATEKAIKSMRKYSLQRDTAEVYTLINSVYDDPNLFEKNSLKMTYVLYDSELTKTNINKENFNPKEGNLLILNIETSTDEKLFIFAKLITKDFFNKQSKKLTPGLDIENLQKVAIFNFTLENELIIVYVKDYTTQTYASYWWNDFLHLKEMTSDQSNTSSLYNRVHTKISRALKANFQSDYYNLKGSTLTYLRTHKTFNFEDFYNETIKNYVPEDTDAIEKISKLKKDIMVLGEKEYFDNHFNIDLSGIKGRQPRKYSLRTGITLTIKDLDIPYYKKYVKKYYKNNSNYAIIELDENNIDDFKEFDVIDINSL